VAGTRTRWAVVVLGLIALVLLGGIVDAAIDVWRANRADAWPTANGVVTESSASPGCGRSGRGTHTSVRYRYRVAGKDYDASRIIFGLPNCASGDFARSSMKEFPVGAAIKVRHDPQTPSEAVLIPGKVYDGTSGALALMTLALVLITAAAPLVIYVIRTNAVAAK
jgi:hypothetical protein